ncbi:MAG TPA: bifunctional diaminohydroxyphosphoribosylaminopyrimidine deaminase/5-amino-6-(5-phosphoribosylamino)uracil reductase RibD [Microbacteriaceae bacterium]|nr:bifunctional diaminohydroxyphosphoribosylaminopyrimidine deaminase/5-amino-6-(5-phosphoribosylamino)uracil reductase RibD [Microbacteriaceae bacterium]
MATDFDWEALMQRAFDAATLGPERGINPRVGCVLVSASGEVLAVGHHRGAGTPHAEVDALSQIDGPLPAGTTAVVSLEPCNHTGRTGPCAEALLAAGIARVVYSVSDPGDASAGGAERLREHGVEVIGGVRSTEGEVVLGSWLVAARLGRPWIVVKWAQSVDGRAAANDGSSQWISGPEARADVHLERSLADGIAVGTGTVIADDPALSARRGDGLYTDQPIPVVFGRREVPATAKLRSGQHEPIFVSGEDLAADLASLPGRGVRTLFVEGGPTLVSSLLTGGWVDELLVYQAPLLLGGARRAIENLGIGTLAEAQHWTFTEVSQLGADLKLRLRRG